MPEFCRSNTIKVEFMMSENQSTEESYRVVSSAPGKVILFGEHAVVHGVTAIAAALSDLRIFVSMDAVRFEESSSPRSVKIDFQDFKDENNIATHVEISFDTIKLVSQNRNDDPTKSVTLTVEEKELLCSHFPNYIPAVGQCLSVITYLVANMLPEVVWNDELPKNQWNLLINIESRGLPVGAGLGSSAAFSVAMVGAVHSMRKCLVSKVIPLWLQDVVVPNVEVLEALNKWAFAAEVLLHGAPSGLDNTTSCYGGLVRFTRKNNPEGEFEPISNVPKLEILLTNTHVPRSTRNLVEGVRLLKVKFPLIFDPIFASIEEISREFLDSVHKYDPSGEHSLTELNEKVAALFAINHNLLNAMGVGHPALTKIVDVSHVRGFSTKLTGAGGGGCAITLVNSDSSPEDIQQLKTELSVCKYSDYDNYVTFESAIGGTGLQWHKP